MNWKRLKRRIAELNGFDTLTGAVVAESAILILLSALLISIGCLVCDIGIVEIAIMSISCAVIIAARVLVRVYGDRIVDALKRRMEKKDQD